LQQNKREGHPCPDMAYVRLVVDGQSGWVVAPLLCLMVYSCAAEALFCSSISFIADTLFSREAKFCQATCNEINFENLFRKLSLYLFEKLFLATVTTSATVTNSAYL
jgi:hypothetical protein